MVYVVGATDSEYFTYKRSSAKTKAMAGVEKYESASVKMQAYPARRAETGAAENKRPLLLMLLLCTVGETHIVSAPDNQPDPFLSGLQKRCVKQ